MKKCLAEGCSSLLYARNKCKKHYQQEYQELHRAELTKRNAPNVDRYRRTAKGQFKSLREGAKIRGYCVGIDFEYFCTLRKLPCFYCGAELVSATGHCMDRKENSLGYTVENTVPCCSECNYTKKHLLTAEEMLAVISFRKESNIVERMLGSC